MKRIRPFHYCFYYIILYQKNTTLTGIQNLYKTMPELTPLFLTAYGLRWFLWEYKWFATARDWLENQHPILKELVGCAYCQSIECFLITWLVFHLNHLTQLHPVEVLGYALFFGWLGWVIASLEKFIPD